VAETSILGGWKRISPTGGNCAKSPTRATFKEKVCIPGEELSTPRVDLGQSTQAKHRPFADDSKIHAFPEKLHIGES